jgi:O-antigen/teichoic acid export membrane protein
MHKNLEFNQDFGMKISENLCSLESFNYLINKLYKSKFARNVAIVSTGTAGAQTIAIVFAPIITRIFGPEAFGQLGTFIAIVTIIIPIAALSYPIAIVLPTEDRDAKGIARLSGYIALSISILLTLGCLTAGDWLVELLKIQAIKPFIFLIPLVTVFAAFLQIAEQWLIRKKRFSIIARVTVLQALIFQSVSSGIGWFYPVGPILIVMYSLGSFLHAAMLGIGIKRLKDSRGQMPKTPLRVLAKKYYDFPLYRAPQVFINAVTLSLPVLMLAAFFGPVPAGFYTLCKKLLGMPSRLIGRSVGDVFYPRITEASHNDENLRALIQKATLALAVVGFPPFAIVVVFGPWLFQFVFGKEWIVAGEYARWMALWLFFAFLNTPSIKALPILSAQKFYLVFTLFSTSIRLTVLAIGYYVFNSDLAAVSLFGIAGAFINIILIFIVFYKSRKFDQGKLQSTN